MGRVCVLSTVNVKHMTMLSIYTDYLERHNIEYDVVYIDKYHEPETIQASQIYAFPLHIERGWSKIRKLFRYYGFRDYAKSILAANDYDFVIVWNGFTSLMFSDLLVGKYRGRYCLNIRDYGYESFLPIYYRMKKAIDNSAFTTISSEGFKKFLPPFEYITIHSLNEKLLSECSPRTCYRQPGQPIRISFIGYVRFFDNDKRLIDALGNDDRFIVQFFGEGAQVLASYARQQGYNNVVCHGRFDPRDTGSFLEQTDVINNLYGVGQVALDTALSIKLYYAVYMHIPILIYEDTYVGEVASNYEIGFAVDHRDYSGLGDKLHAWYRTRDWSMIRDKCNGFVEQIRGSNSALVQALEQSLWTDKG